MIQGLLPVIVDEKFFDGTLVNAAPRCIEKFNKEACEKFYKKLDTESDGYYKCPSGYTVYKRTLEGKVYYYSGICIRGHYDKKKKEGTLAFSKVFFEKLAHEDDDVRRLKMELSSEKEIHRDLLHDVRKLDGLIKDKAQEIVGQYSGEEGTIYDVVQKVRNMGAMEELIACKYSVYDLVSNIGVLSLGNKTRVSIYKKFDKVRYILFNYMNKSTNIEFIGETDFHYYVNLTYFEVLPFLLMENAVKYSSPNRKIVVMFVENNQRLDVSIESYGPYCPKEEVERLFEKNYRGSVVKNITNEGTGIGLYLVKNICDQHGIEIEIETEYVKKNNGLPYGKFKVILHF